MSDQNPFESAKTSALPPAAAEKRSQNARILLWNFGLLLSWPLLFHFVLLGGGYAIGQALNPHFLQDGGIFEGPMVGAVYFLALAPALASLGQAIWNVLRYVRSVRAADGETRPMYLLSAAIILVVGAPVCAGSGLAGFLLIYSISSNQ
ncbi:MAG: hypothetical protein K1X75_01820 [Leptospirales bacterium]|nr:hypothetical protein [Leptospirales bacterium]